MEQDQPVRVLRMQDELQAAYQKEYAFLEAQLRELQARLAEFEREAQQGVREKEAEIDRAEGAFIELQSRGERINDLLIEAEREIGTIEDSRATLEATFRQAESTLEPYALSELAGEPWLARPDAEKIDTLLAIPL